MPKSTKPAPPPEGHDQLPLGPTNYKLILIGVGIIVLGFLLMMGGGSDDPYVFNEAMFSFRRITLAPMVVLFGFLFQIYAIMWRPKDRRTPR